MKKCKNCSTENLKEAVYCADCGTKLSSPKKPIMWIVIVAVIIAACAAYYWYSNEDFELLECSAPENVLESVKENGVLRVAVESEAPPFNYINENGKPEGFEYELITLVAKEMGINSVKLEWTNNYEAIPCMISIENNKADIFMGGYVANSNIAHAAWSNSYYEDGYCLIVPDGSAITNLNDLSGKNIGVYNEDAAFDFVKEKVKNPKGIFRFEDEDEDGTWMMNHLLEPLSRKKKCQLVDAIVYDYVFAKEEIKESDGEIKIVAFNLNRLPYQIGLPKNNYELLKEINRALAIVMNSAQYPNLVKKYLDFDPQSVSLPSLGSDVKIHIVAAGESLGSIAQSYLGSPEKWTDIWDANKTRIPNPNLIHVNDELIIP